jgi:SNF2 family DNA or RNA helicase
MNPALRAFCELSEDGRRIEVWFRYSPEAVAAIKGDGRDDMGVPGRRFVPDKNGIGAHWTIPATITAARRLREAFGQGLTLGDGVKDWGREQARAERNVKALTLAGDAELENVPAPAAAWLRPYQRADVKLMAQKSMGNFNQPGVGKTVEAIYAIKEAELLGPHLVVCPTTLFQDPWIDELTAHAPEARVLHGSTPAERRGALNFTWMEWKAGKADDIWLLINPELIRVQKWDGVGDTPTDELGAPLAILSRDHKGNAYLPKDGTAQNLFEIKWGAVIADEFHKFGLGADRNTQFARALKSLRDNAHRGFPLSGTPMGGKAIRLWGVLNFIEPSEFSSKWRWAEEWLDIDDNGYGKKIGDIKPGRDQEFWDAHSPYFLRRTRKDALPGLPDKVVRDLMVPMTPKQRKAYDRFMRDAEVQLEGGRVVGKGILAEYARGKQFANALCEIVNGEVQPTEESGKLPKLLDLLDTHGVRTDDPEPDAHVIVASESQRMVEMVERFLLGSLAKAGAVVRRLDGTVTGKKRDEVIAWYKEADKGPRVLVMTTQTGGVGLNLGMTDAMFILDETWNPDDQEQLEDRGMRDRETPLMIYYLRTKDSIQEYIWEVAQGKTISNRNIVDIAKKIQKLQRG